MAALLPPDPHDRLKHFKNDGPGWRLGALFLEKLPAILLSAGGLAAAIYGLVKLLH
jgi:hypothetical protein